jgi:hypothetical protein
VHLERVLVRYDADLVGLARTHERDAGAQAPGPER